MKKFESPDVEVEKFEVEDVLTTSTENPTLDNSNLGEKN